MPISLRHRKILKDCRMMRYNKKDEFSSFRKRPSLKKYLAFADKVLDEQWECAGCGRLPDQNHPHFPKHILPPCWGGTDDEDNLLPLCSKCHTMAMAADEALMKQWVEETKKLGRPAPIPTCALELVDNA